MSKIGQIKTVVHRPLVGTPKTCTVRRLAGKWFACFDCEYEPTPLPKSKEAVGIDVGLEKFAALAALSDGSFVDPPDSSVAMRKPLPKRNGNRVKNLLGNYCLAKSISDASMNKAPLFRWSQFRTVLTQKAESAVRRVVEVNPAYTSQDCSGCGHRAKKTLKERWHHCPMCGLSLDRDTNAAFNILKTALGTQCVVAIAA